ncbi:MAG: helix-hairpin-helix domain-containing protein [Chlorobiales bacterium]|nr:helix-hairpin-helix domain-containing protein [Chlorobiales bacterium]
MRILNKLATKLGLTRSEVIIVTLLLGGLFAGLMLKRHSDQKSLSALIREKEAEFFTGTETDSLLALEERRYAESRTGQNGLNLASDAANPVGENKAIPKINFNTATKKELEALPDISPTLADRLIRFRIYKGGKVGSLEELIEVKDIGKKRLEKLTQYLTVE